MVKLTVGFVAAAAILSFTAASHAQALREADAGYQLTSGEIVVFNPGVFTNSADLPTNGSQGSSGGRAVVTSADGSKDGFCSAAKGSPGSIVLQANLDCVTATANVLREEPSANSANELVRAAERISPATSLAISNALADAIEERIGRNFVPERPPAVPTPVRLKDYSPDGCREPWKENCISAARSYCSLVGDFTAVVDPIVRRHAGNKNRAGVDVSCIAGALDRSRTFRSMRRLARTDPAKISGSVFERPNGTGEIWQRVRDRHSDSNLADRYKLNVFPILICRGTNLGSGGFFTGFQHDRGQQYFACSNQVTYFQSVVKSRSREYWWAAGIQRDQSARRWAFNADSLRAQLMSECKGALGDQARLKLQYEADDEPCPDASGPCMLRVHACFLPVWHEAILR